MESPEIFQPKNLAEIAVAEQLRANQEFQIAGSLIENLIELEGEGRERAGDKRCACESKDRSDGDHYGSFFHH